MLRPEFLSSCGLLDALREELRAAAPGPSSFGNLGYSLGTTMVSSPEMLKRPTRSSI